MNKPRSVLASALVGASLALGVSACSMGAPAPAAAPAAGLSPAPTLAAPVATPVAAAPTTKRKADTGKKSATETTAKTARKTATEKTATAAKKTATEEAAAPKKKKGKTAADCERIANESTMSNADLYPYLRSIGCGRALDSAIDDAVAKNGGQRGAH